MPRLAQNRDQDTMRDFVNELRAQSARYGYRSQQSLAEALGVCQMTVSNHFRKFDTVPFATLRAMVKLLHPDPVLLLEALGYTKSEIKRKIGE